MFYFIFEDRDGKRKERHKLFRNKKMGTRFSPTVLYVLIYRIQ